MLILSQFSRELVVVGDDIRVQEKQVDSIELERVERAADGSAHFGECFV